MAGPTIMALGPHQFEAHGFSFVDRNKSQKTGWAEMAVAGTMNTYQWTGGDHISESITGVLFPVELGGEDSLNGVYTSAGKGQVLPLVNLGGGGQNIFDLWFIESIDDKQEFIDRYGRARKDGYTIKLKAFIGDGFSPISVLSILF